MYVLSCDHRNSSSSCIEGANSAAAWWVPSQRLREGRFSSDIQCLFNGITWTLRRNGFALNILRKPISESVRHSLSFVLSAVGQGGLNLVVCSGVGDMDPASQPSPSFPYFCCQEKRKGCYFCFVIPGLPSGHWRTGPSSARLLFSHSGAIREHLMQESPGHC